METSLLITKTLTFTPINPPRPFGRYVYQRVKPGAGNVSGYPGLTLQLRAHVIPLDPKTPAQIARRDLMRSAVARWHTLTTQDKDPYKITAEKRQITVFNAFISDTLKNWHLVGGVLVEK